jgi:hypothetical protein
VARGLAYSAGLIGLVALCVLALRMPSFRMPWSLERRALASYERADRVEVLAIEENAILDATGSPEAIAASVASADCDRRHCIKDHRILGSVMLEAAADRAAVQGVLQDMIRVRPYQAEQAACAPHYRHAVAWLEGGHRYDVLLCYTCGHYTILVDGEPPWWRWRDVSVGRAAVLNGYLRSAGMPYYDSKARDWVAAAAEK